MPEVEKYRVFSLELHGSTDGNPYTDADVSATFTCGDKTVETKGFYRGDSRYEVRFMPDREGEWTYTVHGSSIDEDGESGSFMCTEPGEKNHGMVVLRSSLEEGSGEGLRTGEDMFQFSYEDGTGFIPFGTTCYAWTNQPEKVQEETLKTLSRAPFNKLRMCIFPKSYVYNMEEPELYPFEGSLSEGFSLTRYNDAFFSNLERRIEDLDRLGIEADIILLHPYDRWGFARMTREQDISYLTYTVRRLSHFKNVWWSLANEYDLMPQKSIEDWDAYSGVVMENDVYGHLRSIHNCGELYDYSKSWITHVSAQRMDLYKTSEMIKDWRKEFNKPVIMDEPGYEGNIDFAWGNLTGEEETRRFWEGYIRGGFVTHGETYVDRGDTIWWSHGGVLTGDSVERIAYLRHIMESLPEGTVPLERTKENLRENWDSSCLHCGESFYLYYYGYYRPLYRNYTLPEGKRYTIELIDTWNMKSERLEGVFEGHIRIKMGARQYMAVKMTEVKAGE